jgi:ABC-type branched-subunit amino acid transport system ATPase component/ABC-type branched-subunit amino acid transport system permease subunit
MTPHLATLTVPFVGFELPPEIVVVGAVTGLTYGLLAVGLTLVYKSSRVLNFAHGAMGSLPAALLPLLTIKAGLNYWLAIPLVVAAGVAAGAMLEIVVIRRLRGASRLVAMVATIAAAQVLSAFVLLLPHGPAYLRNRYPTPFDLTVDIGNLRLSAGHVLILFVAPALAVALTLFMNRTSMGLAARATAENDDAALMTGIPVKRVSLIVWSIAGLFAAVSAILVAGTQPLTANSGTTGGLGPPLLVRGLAGAMLGGLESLPLVFAGGIAIGLLEALVQWNYPSAGILNPLLFAVVLASLLVHRRLGAVARGGSDSSWSLAGAASALPRRLAGHPLVRAARNGLLLAAVGGTALVAALSSPSQQVLLSSTLLFALMGLSLVVLMGYAGQVSLGQYAFVALGAIVGGRAAQLGFPSGSALLYAVVAAGVAAAVVGIPALRVRGLFLAVTTLAFALAADGWLFEQDWLVNRGGFGTRRSSFIIARPNWFGIDFGSEVRYAWLCLAVLVLTAFAVHRLRSTGIGRAMLAVRDNEPAAATMSLSPRRVKLIAFVISGMIAGAAGYLYGGLLVDSTAAVRPAPIQLSLSLVVMVVLGGVTTVTGPILGAMWVRGVPYAFGATAGLLSSALGVLVILLVWPGGLASVAFRLRDRIVEWLTGKQVAALREPTVAPTRAPLPARPRVPIPAHDAPPVLAAHDIVVRFGGLAAVDRVSIHARKGEIIGLLGPNGAGKTTLFDVLSGQVRATSGRVDLNGHNITGLRPEQRAQLGLGRTFQQARLFPDLSVFEAVQLGLERREPSEVVPSLLALPPSWRAERRKRERARDVLDVLGLAPYRNRRVSELSTGMRRMAELACVLAVGADVVLLDEPTAGIAQAEVDHFAPVIREIRNHLGATIVIVEHDIPLLVSITDRLYALAAGRIIAEGEPDAVRADPAVVSAYLGTDERVVARSGSGTNGARRAAPPRPTRPDTEVTTGGTR